MPEAEPRPLRTVTSTGASNARGRPPGQLLMDSDAESDLVPGDGFGVGRMAVRTCGSSPSPRAGPVSPSLRGRNAGPGPASRLERRVVRPGATSRRFRSKQPDVD